MKRSRLLLAVAVLALIPFALAPASAGAVTAPSADPFYTAPAGLASYPPGAVLRSREVTVQGLTDLASDTAYQLLYRTTDATGQPVATVATLLIPRHARRGTAQARLLPDGGGQPDAQVRAVLHAADDPYQHAIGRVRADRAGARAGMGCRRPRL